MPTAISVLALPGLFFLVLDFAVCAYAHGASLEFRAKDVEYFRERDTGVETLSFLVVNAVDFHSFSGLIYLKSQNYCIFRYP